MNGDDAKCEVERPRNIGEPEVAVTSAHHEVRIRQVTNGFVVHIGCAEFVSQDWEKLSAALTEYWADPRAAEKKYCR